MVGETRHHLKYKRQSCNNSREGQRRRLPMVYLILEFQAPDWTWDSGCPQCHLCAEVLSWGTWWLHEDSSWIRWNPVNSHHLQNQMHCEICWSIKAKGTSAETFINWISQSDPAKSPSCNIENQLVWRNWKRNYFLGLNQANLVVPRPLFGQICQV